MRIGLAGGDLNLTGNISTGGVGFEIGSGHRVHVGDPIAISVDVPELMEALVLSATVCHVHTLPGSRNYYVGARFIDMDELVQNPLFRFVEESALLDHESLS